MTTWIIVDYEPRTELDGTNAACITLMIQEKMKGMKKMQKKYHGFIVMLVLLGWVVSACQMAPSTPDAVLPETPEQPSPEEEIGFVYGEEAEVESLSIQLLESFPVMAEAVLTGYLLDGCVEIDEITAEREEQTFYLTITTIRPAGDVMCTEALVPFEEAVELDVFGLGAGTYTVIAQDKEAAFTLEQDNRPLEAPDFEEYEEGNEAMVEKMGVNVMESFPVQVSVTLTGNLPDGCTEIDQVTATRDGNTFVIEVKTRRLKGDVACTMVLVPFEEMVQLDVSGLLAGDYQVVYEDRVETFTLDVDNTLPQESSTCPAIQEDESLAQYINRALGIGYCFTMPEGFQRALDEVESNFLVVGPDYGGETMLVNRAALRVAFEPLGGLAFDAYVAQKNEQMGLGVDLEISEVMLGQTPAVMVVGYPAQVESRVVWASYGDQVFQLTFTPLAMEEQERATEDMLYLFDRVLATWTFLGLGE